MSTRVTRRGIRLHLAGSCAGLVMAGCINGGASPLVDKAAAAPPPATVTSTPPGPPPPYTAPPDKPAAPQPPPVSKAVIGVRVGGTPPSSALVALDQTVVVVAVGGRLTSVVVAAGKSKLHGELAPDGARWTSQSFLAPASTYTVTASAVDAAGLVAKKSSRFTTLKPAAVLKTKIAPLNGETVGVGMPVIIYFNHAVADRAAVEKRLRVTSSSRALGGWYWLSDTEVHFRPKVYWPARENVQIDVALAGVNAGNGVWGLESRTVNFAVGRSHVSLVSAAKHTMVVKEDGKVVRSVKVSTGRDEFPTSSGVHVVMSKDAVYWMDSATIGIPRKAPGGYYKKVLSNVRISNSGEFVHAAPWSARAQGVNNVSHGCVNASVEDAAWFFRFSRRGDVVDVVGTPRKLKLGNGFADWTLTWRQWQKGSALAEVQG